MLKAIIEFSLKRRPVVLLAVALFIFLGIDALNNLPSEFLPDLSSPIVSVLTEKPGLAPVEVEALITRRIENGFQSLPNVVNIRSQSLSGLSIVTVTFKWGTDYFLARQFINQRLAETVASLPAGTRPPFLMDAASRLGEVIMYTLTGDSLPLMDLRDIADYDVRLKLQGVPGVARIVNLGGGVRQFQVLVDQDKLRHFGVPLGGIVDALKAGSIDFSGGVISKGPVEYSVRGLGRLTRIEDLFEISVGTHAGMPVYLKELAEIREGPEFRRGFATVNGKEAVRAVVTKQYGMDTRPVIKNLLKAMEDLKRYLPRGVELRTFFNQAELIEVSARNLGEALVIGGVAVLFAVLMLLPSARIALIIAVTLPVSVLITFVFMRFFGITINVMSLGGIAVGLGIMIDAVIVDTENIFRWIRLRPGDSLAATLRGAVEVRRPVAYSTAVIIAVFGPLMFLPGFEGRLFMPFGFTIIASMLVGYALSLTLTPLLCYTLLRGGPAKKTGESRVTKKIAGIYEPLLSRAVKMPGRTILAVLLLLLITIGLVPLIGTELLPPYDENAFLILITMPPGTSLEESARISQSILSVAEKAPDVKNVIAMIGRSEGGGETEGMSNFSENYIELVDRNQRTKSIQEIEGWVRDRISGFPGAVVAFETPLNDRINETISGTKGQLAVKIFGPDVDVLAEKGARLLELMKEIPGVADLVLEQTTGLPFINIRIDRPAAARYGLSPEAVADAAETALEGATAVTVLRGVKETSVFVRLQDRFRSDPEKIRSVLIDAPSGIKVTLGQVARIWKDFGPMMINRENSERRIQVTCNVPGGNINRVVSAIREHVPRLDLPGGYSIAFGGNYASQRELNKRIVSTVIVSLLVVFLLLMTAFHSMWQTLLILVTIPLALMGGVWAMFLTFTKFNVSSLVGFVAHFGLTVQKGVILVEYVNDLRNQGVPAAEAVVRAGRIRMRPVLMTALAATMGVLPLALGMGAGAEIQQPMAIVLIGGLVVSTPIILILLPVLYGQIVKRFVKSG
jgi:cobalt-zinc-cadmium resistance protein CzcA